MTVPLSVDEPEAELDVRRRVLDAAARVFAADGIDAPMPAVARAAGVGVGTVYRRFGSKADLLAALVVERLEWFAWEAEQACLHADAWESLSTLLWTAVERKAGDPVLGQALEVSSGHEDVEVARARVTRSLERLVARAREQGVLRPDVDAADLRLVFAAVRPLMGASAPAGEWKRVLGLLLDGLRAEGAHPLVPRRGDARLPTPPGGERRRSSAGRALHS